MAAPVTSAKASSVVEVVFNPTASIDFASGFTAGEAAVIAVIQRSTNPADIVFDAAVSGAGLWDQGLTIEHTTAGSKYTFTPYSNIAVESGTCTVTYGANADIAAVFCFLYLDVDSLTLEQPAGGVQTHLITTSSGGDPAQHNIYLEPTGGTFDLMPLCLMTAEDGSSLSAFTDDGAGAYAGFQGAQLSDPLDGGITYRFRGDVYYDDVTDFSINITPNAVGAWPVVGRSVFWSYEGGLHQVEGAEPPPPPEEARHVTFYDPGARRRVSVSELPYEVRNLSEEGLW